MTSGTVAIVLLLALIVERAKKGSLAAAVIVGIAVTAGLALLAGLFYLFYLHGSVLFMGITIGIVVVTLLAHLFLKWLTA